MFKKNEYVACFTGRRPKDLCGYNHDAYIPLVEELKKQIIDLHVNHNVNCFITGGAQGFDQLAFWAVNAVKRNNYPIHNVVYVPFSGQEKAWKAEGLFSQKEYNLMLKLADKVQVCFENIDTTNKGQIVQALHGRNHCMVDDSDIVIALYPDTSWKTSKGGTSECMRYASSKNKEIIQISYNPNLTQFVVGSVI
jgi:uncharacterized phage-like protein YoqJ